MISTSYLAASQQTLFWASLYRCLFKGFNYDPFSEIKKQRGLATGVPDDSSFSGRFGADPVTVYGKWLRNITEKFTCQIRVLKSLTQWSMKAITRLKISSRLDRVVVFSLFFVDTVGEGVVSDYNSISDVMRESNSVNVPNEHGVFEVGRGRVALIWKELQCAALYAFWVYLAHSQIHHYETVLNSKKLQTTIEMWLLKDTDCIENIMEGWNSSKWAISPFPLVFSFSFCLQCVKINIYGGKGYG